MAQNLCKINIMGHEYTVRSASPLEEVELIGQMVDERMRGLARSTQTVDSLRSAILTAMTFADEYWQMKKLLDAERKDHLNREQALIQKIDKALGKEAGQHTSQSG